MTLQLDKWHYTQKTWTIDVAEDLVGQEVKLHWHFQERRYSVSLRASNGRWYVVRDHATGEQRYFGKLVLANARFVVQPAGAAKAYRTGKRNVHASVIGTVRKAQFRPEEAVVPCGSSVMYSHNLYPEPEFKLRSIYEVDTHPDHLPGILYAEMLACGIRPDAQHVRRPMMLVAGKLELTR